MNVMSYTDKPVDMEEKGSLWRLFAMPALLTVFLLGLMVMNPQGQAELPKPEPEPPQTVPAAVDPYLKEEEGLRLGVKYDGETVTMIMTPQSYYQGTLVLVNQAQRLPEDYSAQDLVIVRELVETPNQQNFSVTKSQLMLNRETAEKLLAMVQGACEDGVTGYTLVSGHRELSYQVGLFQRKVNQYKSMGLDENAAREKAKQIVAVPGESEHHTGLALDLPSRNHSALETTYINTDNGIWLHDNAWKYGFIVRYPEDKAEITGISYEPWHLRYVGIPHSEIMKRENWCLEEYIEVLRNNGGLRARLSDGSIWQIDYHLSEDGLLQVPLNKEAVISGDGNKGFIVTVLLEK